MYKNVCIACQLSAGPCTIDFRRVVHAPHLMIESQNAKPRAGIQLGVAHQPVKLSIIIESLQSEVKVT